MNQKENSYPNYRYALFIISYYLRFLNTKTSHK